MKIRLAVALLLLVLIAVLLLVLNTQADLQKSQDIDRLTNLSIQSINTINIYRKNGGSLSFEKQDGYWWLTGAQRFRAKPERIDAILSILNSRSFSTIKPGDTELSVFKLQPAELVLELDQHRFSFGGTDPIDARRYVLFKEHIHLINDSLFHQLGQSNMFFLSTKLIPEEERIESIDFGEQRLSRSTSGWTLEPEADKQTKDFPAALARSWQNAKARSVSSFKPRAMLPLISVGLQSGRRAIFSLVSSQPHLTLGRADLGLQYNFSGQAENPLLAKTRTLQ